LEEPVKRFGCFCLIVFLIAIALLAWWQRDLLGAYIFRFIGTIAGEDGSPIDLPEEPPAANGSSGENVEHAASGLKSLARQITAGASTDYEKLCAIYDWVTHNIAYDVEKAGNMEAYGSGAEYLLEKRKGVCHDYADLTRALLKAVGIKATYEKGEVYPAPGKTERHAWNHACIGESWYGLDTTWGAGFVDEEKGIFVQRPSRLYLTTPEELARLHSDPVYKESREMEWQRAEAAAAEPAYLQEYEIRLLELFNEARAATALTPFTAEARLLTAVRQSAAAAAEQACRNEEYSLESLKAEIEQRAPELRLAKAGMNLFAFWDYPIPAAEELYRLITTEGETYLNDPGFESLTVAVVSRGNLIVVAVVYLSYY
jgi:hypothetical protein